MFRTMEGKKKPRPWTVMLSSKKIKEQMRVCRQISFQSFDNLVMRTVGLKKPLHQTLPLTESSTTADPTLSALIRAAHRAFSSSDNQVATSGRSVIMKYDATPMTMVIAPSTRKRLVHW